MAEALGLTWFDLGNAIWIATAAACVGLLSVLILRRRLAPAAHAVTVLASGMLLLAPLLGWSGSRWLGVMSMTKVAAVPAIDPPEKIPVQTQIQWDPERAASQSTFQTTLDIETQPAAALATTPTPSVVSLLDVVMALWIIGSVLAFLSFRARCVTGFRLRQSLRDMADPNATGILQREALALEIPQPRLAESPSVGVPVALGPWRPVIVLPPGFSSQVSAQVLASVLRHELGHLSCRHHAAALLCTLARILWWWHPLAWRLGRVQAELQEEIADNFALSAAPCRQEYASLLLRLAEAAQAVPGPRVGLAMHHRRSGFARRIESLVRKERGLMTQISRGTRWRLGLAAVGFLALLTCLTLRTATIAAQQKEDNPPPPPPQGQGQQKVGGFKVESFRNGKPIPESKATITQEPGKPPVIVYPLSRSSSTWIQIPEGGNVAIGEGIDWQGRTAYLGLTYHLVVADTKTGKALWAANVGAFWDTITFVNVAKGNEATKWVVALRSSENKGFEQTYDLETGKALELTGGAPAPAGTKLTPRKVWSGSAGNRPDKLYRLVGTAEEWSALRTELFGEKPKDIPVAADIDFSKEMLLVCYMGRTSNCNSIQPELVVENDERVMLRLSRSTYQSMGQVPDEYPYGLIVLPRRPGKVHILEYNRQGLIGGPPMWKEFIRLTLPKEG